MCVRHVEVDKSLLGYQLARSSSISINSVNLHNMKSRVSWHCPERKVG